MNATDRDPVQKICICDDDPTVADSIGSLLESERYKACVCRSMHELLNVFEYNRFDLLIVDAAMLGSDGFAFCKELRRTTHLPIVFLVSRDEDIDKVLGFDLGADDYVIKPFKARELLARVKACLRRSSAAGHQISMSKRTQMKVRDLVLDEVKYIATLHGRPLNLTPKEFAILAYLMKVDGRPLSTQDLFEAVWGEVPDIRCNNTVMVHIRHLRKKLSEADPRGEYIETVWGVGYRIV